MRCHPCDEVCRAPTAVYAARSRKGPNRLPIRRQGVGRRLCHTGAQIHSNGDVLGMGRLTASAPVRISATTRGTASQGTLVTNTPSAISPASRNIFALTAARSIGISPDASTPVHVSESTMPTTCIRRSNCVRSLVVRRLIRCVQCAVKLAYCLLAEESSGRSRQPVTTEGGIELSRLRELAIIYRIASRARHAVSIAREDSGL